MTEFDLGFDDIFKEVCLKEYNEFGLRHEMRFISERIIVEYDPTDHLSVREIMHPMDPFRSHEPYFKHKLADKSKKEYVTAIDFHEHITYFPYSKNTGEICLARYISNFNDVNFAKISGQNLCTLPGETIYGLRFGRLDKGMIAVNHRTGSSVNSTVTVMDFVKPSRDLVYYDSPIAVNTIDWIWHGPFLLSIGDDYALRIMDIRTPKAFNAVFFDGGVQKTALCSTRPLEIACWNGSNLLLYDVRRADVPCAVYDFDLEQSEVVLDMKFNPYITNELFIHTNKHRVSAVKINPANLLGGRVLSEKSLPKWQIITFKHIDRGCTATRHTVKRRETMPFEELEIPLLDYCSHFEAAKHDSEIPMPSHWIPPTDVDETVLNRIDTIPEIDFEAYLYKTVERVAAERVYGNTELKLLYKVEGVDTFDFVFPGVNGIMCFDRKNFTYKIARSPKHYEGSVNPYAGSDSVFFYRGLQIQEMIPAQTLTMMCSRLEAGWNAYQISEKTLKNLAFKVTEESQSFWSRWLRNSVIIQYGGKEFSIIGKDGLKWKDLVSLPDGVLPEVEIPPYDHCKSDEPTEEVFEMLSPFFRLFLPDPRPDLLSDSESETDEQAAPPPNPYEDEPPEPETGFPAGLSQNMRTLCKCHAKLRYYNKKRSERKYMYLSMGNAFMVGSSKRIREKFFKLGWKAITKPQILEHRLQIDTRFNRRGILDDLTKFQRFKPREFQKRVLPPKLITDTSSVFMKPEYIKEREEKEKEMREKVAKPIQAPIGLSMPKSKRKEKKSAAVTEQDEEDPERARFMIRAAIQLADNNSSDDEIPVLETTPAQTPTPSAPVPQALSVRNEKDDFEYETPEDAYFGIKKKRMYVVYQPATVPIGLRRYKPDRLGENTFIRRLEHLMYWGKRHHERKILSGRYKENDKRLSSVRDRCTVDLKTALMNHKKVGWQTFYDKNFFFSNKCSYNQILRKAIEMYNRICGFETYNPTTQHVRHERMLFGVKPRYILNEESASEVMELKNKFTVIENITIQMYNNFMNYIQTQLPYKLDSDMSLERFEGEVISDQKPEKFVQPEKQTAQYDRSESYMFPSGILRFCEYDIQPQIMLEIEKRRKKGSLRKHPCFYLEDIDLPSHLKTEHSSLRRTSSSPDLYLDAAPTEHDRCHNHILAEVVRRATAKRFLNELRGVNETVNHIGPLSYETDSSANVPGLLNQLQNDIIEGVTNNKEKIFNSTQFIEWASPIIFDIDRTTGRVNLKKVVPPKEPQPPRQLSSFDPLFDFVSVEVLLSAAKSFNVSYIVNDPILRTWPGLQMLDERNGEMFAPGSSLQVKQKYIQSNNVEYKAPLSLPPGKRVPSSNTFSETMLINEHCKNRIRPPIFDEHSINIPRALIDLLKPGFYGFFESEEKCRYNEQQSAEMKNRRELQQAILQKRIITLRQPVIEETEQELQTEENLNVEEDDLKTTSEESGAENDDENIHGNLKNNHAGVTYETIKDDQLGRDEETFDFWKMFREHDEDVDDGKELDEVHAKNKAGVFYTEADESPSYTRFNPHTRANIRKIYVKENELEDESKKLGSMLNNLFDETLVKERRCGDCPLGSPNKSSLTRLLHPEHRDIVVPLTELAKQAKSVTWGEVIEHSVPAHQTRHKIRHQVLAGLSFTQDLSNNQPTRRVKSTGNFQKFRRARKNSDPTIVQHIGLPRRASLDQFYKKDLPSTCSSCTEEPWPTKEECIVCHPETSIYRCTNIVNLNEHCHVCGNNIYKFSCMNYNNQTQYSNNLPYPFGQLKLQPVDEKLREKFAAPTETAETSYEDTPAIWTMKPYRTGESAVDTLLSKSDDRTFRKLQVEQMSSIFLREFKWVTWRMDEDKSEKIFLSEQFDVAFNRDADIDMMRDTMNTISQDGEMDMMTTYDQRTGMRVRRWISFSALATRVQKQTDKARYRKRVAEREARILSGEISVRASLLNELKKKVMEKEIAATKVVEIDDAKREEERRREYKLWKKLPIPDFVEDPKKEMPNFAPPKSEDWLESSGSEDELPPIKSRMLSQEIKHFIEIIREHMEKKPKNFNGPRVTYGKLFEKRPILKNDIVLVTKKKTPNRKPPPFRIQKIPLDENWLNTAIHVFFQPTTVQTSHPRDSRKWTIPFYNSKRLALTAEETKARTFRPPTPPLTLKTVYKKMKHIEKEYYHRQNIERLRSLRKAKVSRQMRFHRRLYGRDKMPKSTPKAWTNSRRLMFKRKSSSQRKFASPCLPRIPDYKKYIFSYVPKTTRKKLRLSERKQSRISSSDSEYCPIVRIPKFGNTFTNLQEDVESIRLFSGNNDKQAHPLRLMDRKKKQLKRESVSDVSQSSSKLLKMPESGQLEKRQHGSIGEITSDPNKASPQQKPKKSGKRQYVDAAENSFHEPKRSQVFSCLEDDSIDNFSQGIPAISLVENYVPQKRRESRGEKKKNTANSETSDLVGLALQRVKKNDASKSSTRRTCSAVTNGKKTRKRHPIIRSFSVDTGTFYKKALKKMIRACKKDRQLNNRVENKMKVSDSLPKQINDLQSDAIPEKSFSSADDQFSSNLTVTEPMNSKDVKTFSNRAVRRTKKLKKEEKPRVLKDELSKKHFKRKISLCRSSRSDGAHHERPLQPRWLPTDHESDNLDRRAASQFRFQHMRFKQYSRKVLALHKEPTRSRVLNTIRRMDATMEKNREMKYMEPLNNKISDLFLNPWKQWPKSKKSSLKKNQCISNNKMNDLSEIQPLSWKQMMRKLADYNVCIKRIRLSKLKKMKLKNHSEDLEPVEKILEIVVKPCYNLKSCLKREQGRRSMRFISQPTGASQTDKLETIRTNADPSPEYSSPKSLYAAPLFLDLENSSLKNTWLTGNTKPTKNDKPDNEQSLSLSSLYTVCREETPEISDTESLVSPGRIIRSLPSECLSNEKLDEDEVEASSAPIPAPPSKMPIDQQWRAAMMARRYMGVTKPKPATSSPSKKGVATPDTFKEADENASSSTKVETAENIAISSTSPLQKTTSPREVTGGPQSNVSTANAQLTRMTVTKSQDIKEYAVPIAKPKATAPPPVTLKTPTVKPISPKLYSSEDNGQKSVTLASGTPGFGKRQEPAVKKLEVKTNFPVAPERLKEQSSLSGSIPQNKNQSSSLFTALFGKKKTSPSSSVSESPGTPAASPSKNAETSIEKDDRSSPILPKIKKPETGQLMKRSPTSDIPKPMVVTGNIVKFVDGKPILNSPTYQNTMPNRRRRKSEPSPEHEDNSPRSSNSSIPAGESEKKLYLEEARSISDEADVVDSANTMETSPQKKSAGKTVRFGPTSYEPRKLVTPETTRESHVVLKPEVSFETLAEQMQKEQQEKEKNTRKLDEQVAQEQVTPAIPQHQASFKTSSKLKIFGLSPFGRVIPKQNAAPQAASSAQPSTSETSLPGHLTSRDSVLSTSAMETPAPSLIRKNASSSSDEKSGEIDNRSRPTKRTSHRRQLKMGDPSPLQLSGDSSLPRPAQPSPEKPPQLDVPKGVQTYNPLSQRKYYTRLGREWKPQKSKVPLRVKAEETIPTSSSETLPTDAPKAPKPAEKRKKFRKRIPKVMETTLTLDGTDHFSRLTSENLKLLDREFELKCKPGTMSLKGFDESDDTRKCLPNNKVFEIFRDLKKQVIEGHANEGKMVRRNVAFDPFIDDSVSIKQHNFVKKPKFETATEKIKRKESTRKHRILASGIRSLSKRDSAIHAIRQVQKVRFFQDNNKAMVAPIKSNFKPKSILKPPKPPIKWFYRIDSDGNKFYMKKFGPSDWQKKMDDKQNLTSTRSLIKTKKKSSSYLKHWAKVIAKLGKKNITQLLETTHQGLKLLPVAKRSDTFPKDVIVKTPKLNALPPSRTLSWTSVSTNASLNSLLDALNAVGGDYVPTNRPNRGTMSPLTKPSIPESHPLPREESATNVISKNYPTVYVGMTVARSPSVSNSAMSISDNDAISSVAQDGSEIVEYVGQEENSPETAKRRFDPFVRPISALFKALSSNSTEVGLEAISRSRSTDRSLGGLFRRSSPAMPEFSARHASSSPTRRRSNRGPLTSVSQGSSAEDILALMQSQPNALETMEENAKSKFPSLLLPPEIADAKPMWRPKLKLKNSLYTQFKKLKEESRQKKLVNYLDYYHNSNKSYSAFKKLVAFDLDQYMRTNRYPKPSLNIRLLGKYNRESLKTNCSSRSRIKRSTAVILKKIKECERRFEKAKKSTQAKAADPIFNNKLKKRTKKSVKRFSNKRSKKIRVLYKFKRTCVKYRVQVTVSKSARKILASQNENKEKHDKRITTTTILTVAVGNDSAVPENSENVSANEKCPPAQVEVTDYDGDDDNDIIDEELEWLAETKPVVVRRNQRKKLLRHYFNFAIRMARKISRRSARVKKPFVFYAFINQVRSRMRDFMNIRQQDKDFERLKKKIASKKLITGPRKCREYSCKKVGRDRQEPTCLRDSLKHGGTTPKRVVIEQSKYDFLKLNAKLGTFFECLNEYIDVGTPIKLLFSSRNTILPKKMFDSKVKLTDPAYYTSTSVGNTDSDFSDDAPGMPKSSRADEFFERESLESTFHVKGLPGLIYLARLVQERVGDDVERDIAFSGPALDTSSLVVYMSPVRRLMLCSLGLRMPDRLDDVIVHKLHNERFEMWFELLFRMLCYGRGDLCKQVIDKIAMGQGPPNKKYERMDVTYQAHIIHKLFKKMMYLENGREVKLAINEFFTIGLDIDREPFSKQVKMGPYDRMLYGNPKPWTRENWIEACDQFLNYASDKNEVHVAGQGALLVMRMVFLGGYSQDIVDQIVKMKISIRDKLLFIINLSPSEYIVENVVKVFHIVRGLDRLPFVGLGYHADPLRVLFEEAIESGDPQLIAHIIRIGRCLDRRSREPLMTDCGSDHIKNRDFASIMTSIFTRGHEKKPFGAPTMDEMFPFRYVRHADGSEVTETTEELASIMECEVTRYMAILELCKGVAVTKGDLDHNSKFNTYPSKFYFDVICTGCKMNVAKARNLGRLGRHLCVSTMPLIEQDKDKKRWPSAKTMSPRLTFENYIETLDPTENKMLMAKDIEEEKTDITVQVLPSRFGCFQCRFTLPRCSICMCPYLNDHMDYALNEFNDRFSQFSICNICNHGGHINHIATWFESEKHCPVAGCDCKCLRSKQTKNLKAKLRRHMLLSANMRAKSHLCNPDCATEADIQEGFLPDPDLNLI